MLNSMNKRNLFASIILIILCGFYAYFTANLETRNIQNTTQPSFFPWIITVCLAILSFSLLLQSFLLKKGQTLKKTKASKAGKVNMTGIRTRKQNPRSRRLKVINKPTNIKRGGRI